MTSRPVKISDTASSEGGGGGGGGCGWSECDHNEDVVGPVLCPIHSSALLDI